MKAGIYIRVSTVDQTKGTSLEDQRRVCSEYAERQGWQVVKEYVEPGRSAYKHPEKREKFQEMLSDARHNRIEAIVVFKFDRFAREALLQLQAAADLEQAGITLHSATEPSKRSSSDGRLSFTVIAAVSQFESDKTSERVAESRRTAVMHGILVGPTPVGYTKGSDNTLVPSADAPAVKLAYELYATGNHSYVTVADALNARGYRIYNVQIGERTYYTKANVREILQRPVYKGEVWLKGKTFPGRHEPLVSSELWENVQRVRSSFTRGSSAHGRVMQRRIPTGRGLFVNMALCAACNAKMWYQGGDKQYTYYRCSNRERRTEKNGQPCKMCDARMVRAVRVEGEMDALLHTLDIPADVRGKIVARARELLQRDTQPVEPPPEVDVQAVESRWQRVKLQFREGDISEEEYRAEKAQYQRHTAPIRHTPTPSAWNAQHLEALLDDIPSLLAQTDLEQRCELVRLFVETVWLESTKIKAIRPTPIAYALLSVLREGENLDSVSRVGIEPTTL